MASYSTAVFPVNKFDEAKRAVADLDHETCRYTAHAIARRARQYIIEWDAIITGNLLRSIDVDTTAGALATVFASMDYASFVHDGTEHMRRRPFLEQAAADQVADTEEFMAARMRRLQ